jgi:hypothetical protein
MTIADADKLLAELNTASRRLKRSKRHELVLFVGDASSALGRCRLFWLLVVLSLRAFEDHDDNDDSDCRGRVQRRTQENASLLCDGNCRTVAIITNRRCRAATSMIS